MSRFFEPNKKYKNFISLILAISMILSMVLPAYSSSDTVSLPSFFDDTQSGSAMDVSVSSSALSFADDAVFRLFDAEVGKFRISHTYGATNPDGSENYGGDTWYADDSRAGHSYEFNINYSTGGSFDIPAGQLAIVIPLHILMGSTYSTIGSYDKLILSIPHENEVVGFDTTAIPLVYKDKDAGGAQLQYDFGDGRGLVDAVIIYNTNAISAGSGGSIEVSYTTTQSTTEYKDCHEPHEAGDEIGTFRAEISTEGGAAGTYQKPRDVEPSQPDSLDVYMNTTAKLVEGSTTKTITSAAYSLDELKKIYTFDADYDPADKDLYDYYVWTVKSTTKDITQKYNFYIKDTETYIVDKDGNQLTDGADPIYGEWVAYNTYEDYKYKLVTPAAVANGVPSYSEYLQRNCVRAGERTDHVITRYLKSSLPVDEKYTVENRVDVRLEPVREIDPDISNNDVWGEFEYEPPRDPVDSPPVVGIYNYKNGLYGNNSLVGNYTHISSYELEKLTELDGELYVKYQLQSTILPYPNTVTDPSVLTGVMDNDYVYYGRERVTHVMTDDTLSLTSVGELQPGEYTFTDLYMDVRSYDADYVSASKRFVLNENEVKYESGDVVKLYLKTDDNADYSATPAAVFDLYAGTGSVNDPAHVTSVSSIGFGLTGNVTGWKLETSTRHYQTVMVVRPGVKVKASDRIATAVTALKDAAEAPESGEAKAYSATLKNTAGYVTTDFNDAPLSDETVSANDYLSSSTKASKITKNYTATVNQPLYRNFVVSWEVNASETQRLQSGNVGVEQSSGTFYDLLPESGRADLDSLKVYADGALLESYQYKTSVVHNYSDGRNLLKVQINKSAPDGSYKITYDTIHSWSDILQFGRYAINYVAYETGNDTITKGYPDNGGNTGVAGMNDLDPDTDARRFIYDQKNIYLNALISTTSSIDKRVAIDPDAEFTYSTTVNPESRYVYRVSVSNDQHTISSNIFVMDSLEDYIVDPTADPPVKSDWQGKLVDIDVTNAILQDVNAVVYLSEDEITFSATAADNIIKSISDMPGTWVEMSAFKASHGGSLEDAKSIVVDLSKKLSDPTADFELKPGGAVGFDIYMRSLPSSEAKLLDVDHSNAYNDVAYSYTGKDTTVTYDDPANPVDPDHPILPADYWVNKGYTTVTYHTTGNLVLEKKDYNTNGAIEGIRFSLTGCSYYGTEIDDVLVTDADGVAEYYGLERGTYLLEEIYSSPDYQRDKTVRTVVVDDVGKVKVLGKDGDMFTEISGEGTVTASYDVKNKPRVHGDLVFYKVDYNDITVPVQGARFELTGVSNYGNTIQLPDPTDADAVALATSDALGKVRINDIEYGTYTLKETVYSAEYAPIITEYIVNCDADGNISLYDKNLVPLTRNSSGRYNIKNIKYKAFTLRKVDAVNNTEKLSGAKFTLTRDDDDEFDFEFESSYPTSQIQYSDVTGIAVFSKLIPGNYTLTEDEAPDNHTKLFDSIKVKVGMDGTLTVSGAPTGVVLDPVTGSEEDKIITNDREYNEYIRVIKKWVGAAPDFDDDEHIKFPVLYLSSNEPEIPDKYATIRKDLFKSVVDNAAVVTFAPASDYRLYETKEQIEAAYPGYTVTRVTDRDSTGSYITETNGGLVSFDCSDEKGEVWLAKSSDGKTVYYFTNAVKVYLPQNCDDLFYHKGYNLKSVNITGLYPDRVTTMQRMFAFENKDRGAKQDGNLSGAKLETIILGDSFKNGLNVKSTFNMFAECQNLTTLSGIENFETSDLTETVTPTARLIDMAHMFAGCRKLTSLNISSLKTSAVTDMTHSFRKCMALKTFLADKDKFKADSLETAWRMFDDCEELQGLDLRGFTSCPNFTDGRSWFANCYKLEYIDLKNFVPTTFTKKDYMFQGVSKNTANGVKIFVGTNWTNPGTTLTGTNIADRQPKINLYDNVYQVPNQNDYKGVFRTWIAPAGLESYVTNGAINSGVGYFMDANSTYYTDWAAANYTSASGLSLDTVDVSEYSLVSTPSSYFDAAMDDMMYSYAENVFVSAFEGESSSTASYPVVDYKTYATAGTQKTYTNPADPLDTYDYYEVEDEVTIKTLDENGDEQTKTISAGSAIWTVIDDSDPDNQIWACDIPVYSSTAQYYVWEDDYTDEYAGISYVGDALIDNPKQTNTGVVTITNVKDGTTVPPETFGSLTLTKQLTKSGTAVTNDNTGFNFTITFTHADDSPISGTYYLGTAVLNDGVINTVLSAGQSFTLTDIPQGWKYKIVENGDFATTYYGYTNKTGADNAATSGEVRGIIANDEDSSGDVEDEELLDEVEWENQVIVRDPVDLSVTKNVRLYNQVKIDGVVSVSDSDYVSLTDTEKNKEFTYTANFTNLDRSGNYTIEIDGAAYATFYSDAAGNASGVTFKLKDGQTARFVGLPEGTVYTVTEAAAADYVPEYSGAGTGSAAKNTALSVADKTLSTATAIIFTNTKTQVENRRATIAITVTKKWENEDGSLMSDAELEAAVAAGTLPESLTVQVKQYEKVPNDPDDLSKGYTLNEKKYVFSILLERVRNSFIWTGTQDGIYQKSSGGNYYVYVVQEPKVSGFQKVETTGNNVTETDGNVVITNKVNPTYNFTLTKNVTGNMGNRAKKFTFSLVFTNSDPNIEVDGFYDVYDGSGNFLRQIAVNNGHTSNVTLSSGESIVIRRLPEKTTVTVSELDGDDYHTEYVKTDSNGTASDDDYTKGDAVQVVLTDSNGQITFTNSRNALLPTGVTQDPKLTIMLGMAVLSALIMMLKRRRKNID